SSPIEPNPLQTLADPARIRANTGASPESLQCCDPRLHQQWRGMERDMDDRVFELVAIALYFALMLMLRWLAFRRSKNLNDYMLAGRGLKPGVAALSAGASDMSGWLLMGLPGAIYVAGLVEAWIAIGLTIGAWLNWKFVAPKLRAYTEVAGNSITIPSFIERRVRDQARVPRA